jgi:HEAT repeat protein
MFRRTVAIAALLALAGFDWIGKVELDAEGLNSENPQTRVKAVRKLAQYDIEFTRAYLLEALEDDDGKVRAEAGRVCAIHRVADAVPLVIEWLGDHDADTKQAAARVLGDLGSDKAVQPLIRALGDPDPQVRYHVVVALGKIGSPQVVVPLLGRLEDDKPDVRRGAIEQLAGLGDRRAVIPLVGSFNDSSVEVRLAAVKAVGRLGDKAAVPALSRLLRDAHDRVQIAAVTALGNLEAVEAADDLVKQLRRSSASNEMRTKVAYALGKIGRAGHERSLEVLVESLGNGSTFVQAARESLLLAGKAAVPALIRHLEGELDGDPTAAVQLLRDAGDPSATAALVKELERGRVSREIVLEALGQSGDSTALVPVLTLLDDPDPAVRLNAMRALRPLLDEPAADVLIAALDDDELEVKVLAAEYLGIIESAAAVPRLIRTAQGDGKVRLRATAIWALGSIHHDDAVDALVELLRTGPRALRRGAADALIAIKSPAAVEPLLAIARNSSGSSRGQAVRALGGVLRDQDEGDVRALLESLARKASLSVGLAAISSLGAMQDGKSNELLLDIAANGDTDRRRAALVALGDAGDSTALPVLLEAMRARDDSVAAAAAWSIGKRGAGGKAGPARDTIEALIRATERKSWATPVNASAALARIATDAHAADLLPLLHHRNRFVRTNAVYALGRLGSTDARVPLTLIVTRDQSWLVRRAAARALGAIGGGDEALAAAISGDSDEHVRAAAKRAHSGKTFKPPKRNEWRAFYFVYADDADQPVRQEPYFLIAGDGLVTAIYTDSRGEYVEESFTSGEHVIDPESRAEQY